MANPITTVTEAVENARLFWATVARATCAVTTPAITAGNLTSYDTNSFDAAEAASSVVTPCVVTELHREKDGRFSTESFQFGGANNKFYQTSELLYCPLEGNPPYTVLAPYLITQLDNV